MIQFLTSHNITVSPSLTKSAIYNVVQEQHFKPVYAVEKLCNDMGVDVLRLPPYHCMLNPIELAWAQLKRAVRRMNTEPTNPTSVIKHIHEAVKNVTQENWSNFVRHVIRLECDMKNRECVIIHDSLKNICLALSDSDSDE